MKTILHTYNTIIEGKETKVDFFDVSLKSSKINPEVYYFEYESNIGFGKVSFTNHQNGSVSNVDTECMNKVFLRNLCIAFSKKLSRVIVS